MSNSYTDKIKKALEGKICCIKNEIDAQEPVMMSYNSTTGELTLTDQNGVETTVNLPLEQFLSQAVYDADTNVLTLTMSDNTTFDVDLSDLVDASFIPYEEITYANLRLAINDETLVPGKKYGITDYITYYINNFGDYTLADGIELLVVTASSNSTLEPLAFSPTYPLDTIWYDPGTLVDFNLYTNYRGTITRRSVDHIDYANMGYVSKIDVPFDFRTIKVVKSKLSSSWLSTKEYDGGTPYIIGDFVVFGTKLTRCIQNNTGVGEDYNYFELIDEDVLNTYYLNTSINIHEGYIPYADTSNAIESFTIDISTTYNIIIKSKSNFFIPNIRFHIENSKDINIQCETINEIEGLHINGSTNVNINGSLKNSIIYYVDSTDFNLHGSTVFKSIYNYIGRVNGFKFENQILNTFVKFIWYSSLKCYNLSGEFSLTFLSCQDGRGYYNDIVLNETTKIVLKGTQDRYFSNNKIDVGGHLSLIGQINDNNLKWVNTYDIGQELGDYNYSSTLYEGLNWCYYLQKVIINAKTCYFKLLEFNDAIINISDNFLYATPDLPNNFNITGRNFLVLNPNSGALIENGVSINVGDFVFRIGSGNSGSYTISHSDITLSYFYFPTQGGNLHINDSTISGKQINIDAVDQLIIERSTLSNIDLTYNQGILLSIIDSTINNKIYLLCNNDLVLKRCNIPNGLPWPYTLTTGTLAATQYTKNIFYNTVGDVKAMYMVGTTPTIVDFDS